MFTRLTLALVASLALAASVRAADPPTGTWTANVDGRKGDFVIKEVKAGKVTGTMLGTDFTGTWNEKTLTFRIALATYHAHLVTEEGGDGKIKYTLTGTCEFAQRVETRVQIHVVATVGWYAQMTAATPVANGEIKAEVRGVLVIDASGTYISVKRKSGDEVEETVVRVFPTTPNDEPAKTLKELKGKEVIASGKLGQLHKASGELYFLDAPQIRLAPAPK